MAPSLPHLGLAFLYLLHGEGVGKMTGFQLHVDQNFAARLVDDIVALATRHDFIPVIGEEFIQVRQRILHVGRLVLLAFLVVNGRAHKVARIEGRKNDFLQGRRVVEEGVNYSM
jgi:hypothetical protein